MKPVAYSTEADLCADFTAWVRRQSGTYSFGVKCPTWTPYAETAGWDILLVAEDGTQIGIQAKLRFNLKVLYQAVPERFAEWHDSGPDYRAILVPDRNTDGDRLCAALGIMLFCPDGIDYSVDGPKRGFGPGLHMQHSSGWHYWSPKQRCKLPDYVPDVPAGASGPVQLTQWKVAALRLVARLEINGFVTRKDFAQLRIDPRRWTGPDGWLQTTETPGRYVRGPGLDFDKQHPVVYAEVLKETRDVIAQEVATS